MRITGAKDVHSRVAGWKRKIVDEMVEYYLNFVYLAFFLVAFAWYRRLILAEYDILYLNYWAPLVEAAVLAKVIMVGDMVRLGRGLERQPLLVPTLFRTVLFSVWVGCSASWNAPLADCSKGKA